MSPARAHGAGEKEGEGVEEEDLYCSTCRRNHEWEIRVTIGMKWDVDGATRSLWV